MPNSSLEIDTAGGKLISRGQNFVRYNGNKIIVLNDPVTPHGIPPHSSAVMISCSNFVRINNLGVVRQNDRASCGHIATASSTVNISS